MNRPRVYVAGPLTKPDPDKNARTAIAIGIDLARWGFAPLVPHFWHLAEGAYDIDYAAWLEIDLAWVQSADAVLRLPGESTGADMEVACAQAHGVPVVRSVGDLLALFPALLAA